MNNVIVLFTTILMLSGTIAGQVVDPTGDWILQTEARHALTADDLGVWIRPTLETHTSIDPGSPPEGDFLGGMAFSRDGSRVFVCNRMTDNVTVFDWATMQAIATVPVGRYPHGIAVSDDYAVVACAFGDKVYLLDLVTLTATDSIATGEQPWVVRISADQRYAYVSCDIANTCEVIDLSTRTHVLTISNFPIFLRTWSWNSANGRNDVTFSEFELSPDGQHIIVSGLDSSIHYYNTATGALQFQVPGIMAGATLGISGDSTKLIAVTSQSPPRVYRIDVATRAVLDSVLVNGYTLSTFQVAVNQDGSKCYLGVSNNRSALVRFSTHDFVTFTQTYTAFWIGVTHDHRYAVSGQYNFSVVDMLTETVAGQSTGYSQSRGAVAPFHSYAAGEDPHRHEGIYFFDLTAPSTPVYRGTTMSGQPPEGDAPRRAAITPDRSKLVVANELSDNISIINLSTLETEAIVPAGDGPWDIAVTPDSRWAVVAGFNSNQAHVIDLETNSVAANVQAGTRPGTVVVSPDGLYAYLGNIQSNTISVVQLNGANSTEIAQIPCGEIGIVWASFGVFSGLAISPSGRWVLVAVSFDDQVKVIDTWTNTVVATLVVGDFPLDVAFASSDGYAVVTNYFGSTYSVMHIDGPNSSVVGSFPGGAYPLRLAYNPVDDEMGVASYQDKVVRRINPYTGALIGTVSYTAYGNITGIGYGEAGEAVVLTTPTGNAPARLHRGTDHVELTASPAFFTLDASGLLAAVTIPGPDWVTVVDWRLPPLPPADVTVYSVNGAARLRFAAEEAGTYVVYSSTDPGGIWPDDYSELHRMDCQPGTNMWIHEAASAAFRKYVVVQER